MTQAVTLTEASKATALAQTESQCIGNYYGGCGGNWGWPYYGYGYRSWYYPGCGNNWWGGCCGCCGGHHHHGCGGCRYNHYC